MYIQISDPYMLLLAGLHTYLTGGMATFLTVTHRYVVINTDPEHRSLRFTIFQIYLLAGKWIHYPLTKLSDD